MYNIFLRIDDDTFSGSSENYMISQVDSKAADNEA